MDKHERPYKCPHKKCAKREGFTLTTTMNRHYRAVHLKKKSWFCTFEKCARNTDGFTRREHLESQYTHGHKINGKRKRGRPPSGQPSKRRKREEVIDIKEEAKDPEEEAKELKAKIEYHKGQIEKLAEELEELRSGGVTHNPLTLTVAPSRQRTPPRREGLRKRLPRCSAR